MSPAIARTMPAAITITPRARQPCRSAGAPTLPLGQVGNRVGATAARTLVSQPSPSNRCSPALRLQDVQVTRQPIQPAANTPLWADPSPPAAAADSAVGVQIHALLEQLVAIESPVFQRAVQALALTGPSLTRLHTGALLRALKALPPAIGAPTRQQLLRAALYDLTRAADADLLLHARIERHGIRQRASALPGSENSTVRRGTLAAALGLPAALHARLAAGAGWETGTGTGEDLTVATIRAARLQGDASVQAGVATGLGVEATAAGFVIRGEADIASSMRTHVLGLAYSSMSRRLGGNRLLRTLKDTVGGKRDRYAERTSRALAWQPRVQMLLGDAGVAQAPLFGTRAPVPIHARITRVGGSLAANAAAGIAQLALSGEATRATFRASLPTRLTDLDGSGVPACNQPHIRDAVDARIAPLLTGRLRSPTLRQVQRLRDGDRRGDGIGARIDAVRQLRSEFDHLEALARHVLVAPKRARPILASLCRDWGSATPECEPVMIRMLDTLAWLQAAPRPQRDDDADPTAWTGLQEAVQALASRIHDTSLPHDARRVHLATHGVRVMTQRVTTQRGMLDLSAGTRTAGVAAKATLARQLREDPDPLRVGRYLELTLGVDVTAGIGPLLAEVQRRWPAEWGALPVQEVQHLLSSLSPTLTATGSAQYLVRFFAPAFQDDPDFPEAARGSHLQTVRLATGATGGFAFKVPLPLFPAVNATLGIAYRHSAQHTRHERLCASTLTGTLLRYQSLCTKVRRNVDTWAVLVQSHGEDLDRLGQALATPESVPAREARYWLQQGDDGAETLLDAIAQAADADARQARLFELFEALGVATAQRKAASPLLGTLTLSAASQA